MNSNDSTHEELLLLRDVKQRVGISSAHIYKLMSAGRFPKNFRHYGRRVVWKKTDINAWIADAIQRAGI